MNARDDNGSQSDGRAHVWANQFRLSGIERRRERALRKPSLPSVYHSAPRRVEILHSQSGRQEGTRFGVQLDARRDAARLSG